MAQAYVLLNTEVKKVKELKASLGAIDGVRNVDAITGPYDLIVAIEAEDNEALGSLVIDSISTQNGVVHTLTCAVV